MERQSWEIERKRLSQAMGPGGVGAIRLWTRQCMRLDCKFPRNTGANHAKFEDGRDNLVWRQARTMCLEL